MNLFRKKPPEPTETLQQMLKRHRLEIAKAIAADAGIPLSCCEQCGHTFIAHTNTSQEPQHYCENCQTKRYL